MQYLYQIRLRGCVVHDEEVATETRSIRDQKEIQQEEVLSKLFSYR